MECASQLSPPNVDDVRKPLREEKPAARSRLVPLSTAATTRGENDGVLDRDPPVALHEHEQDVLAAQRGQSLAGRGAAEAVVPDLVGEHRVVLDAGLHGADFVGDQAGGARGGDGRVGDDLRAERPARHPDDAECRDGRERPAAVAGRDPGQAQHRQGRDHEQGDAEHGRAGDDQIRFRVADRVAQRLDADAGVAPIGHGVERPVEGLEEPHVEDLHDDEQAEHRAQDAGQGASSPRGQHEGQGDDGEALERDPHECAGRETTELIRSDERGPHDEKSQDREHRGEPGSHGSAPRAGMSGGCESGAPGGNHRRTPVDPQPGDIAAERLGEQGERGEDGDLRRSERHDARGRDRQHDSLRRSDDLAPVAGRQLRTHPRQQPPGCQKRIACRPDRDHPPAGRAGDVHAEHENQERVDLSVELRAQRRRRPCASHDPAVDPVQHERDGCERHEQRDLRGPVERVGDQPRDADGDRGPGQGHPIGRAQPLAAEAGDAERECRIVTTPQVTPATQPAPPRPTVSASAASSST